MQDAKVSRSIRELLSPICRCSRLFQWRLSNKSLTLCCWVAVTLIAIAPFKLHADEPPTFLVQVGSEQGMEAAGKWILQLAGKEEFQSLLFEKLRGNGNGNGPGDNINLALKTLGQADRTKPLGQWCCMYLTPARYKWGSQDGEPHVRYVYLILSTSQLFNANPGVQVSPDGGKSTLTALGNNEFIWQTQNFAETRYLKLYQDGLVLHCEKKTLLDVADARLNQLLPQDLSPTKVSFRILADQLSPKFIERQIEKCQESDALEFRQLSSQNRVAELAFSKQVCALRDEVWRSTSDLTLSANLSLDRKQLELEIICKARPETRLARLQKLFSPRGNRFAATLDPTADFNLAVHLADNVSLEIDGNNQPALPGGWLSELLNAWTRNAKPAQPDSGFTQLIATLESGLFSGAEQISPMLIGVVNEIDSTAHRASGFIRWQSPDPLITKSIADRFTSTENDLADASLPSQETTGSVPDGSGTKTSLHVHEDVVTVKFELGSNPTSASSPSVPEPSYLQPVSSTEGMPAVYLEGSTRALAQQVVHNLKEKKLASHILAHLGRGRFSASIQEIDGELHILVIFDERSLKGTAFAIADSIGTGIQQSPLGALLNPNLFSDKPADATAPWNQ